MATPTKKKEAATPTVVVAAAAAPSPAAVRSLRGFSTLKWAVLLLVAYQLVVASGLLAALLARENNVLWFTSPPAAVGQYMNASACVGTGVLKKMVFPRPHTQPGQVLIKVEKASGNPVDFKMCLFGAHIIKQMPFVSGYDFAGRIVETSSAKFPVGQRVFGMLPAGSPRWGTFAEYVAVDEEFVARMPDELTMTQAAALPLASLTALQALGRLGAVAEGESILIHAGSGGVGTFAIQFAKHVLKLKVFTTSTNVDLCQSLGADRVINYRTEDFASVVGEVDYVLDSIGGEYLLRGVRRCRQKYLSIFNSGWQDLFGFPPMIFVGEVASTVIINVMHYATFGAFWPTYEMTRVRSNGAQLELIAEWVVQGKIKVVVDSASEELRGLTSGPAKVHALLEAGRTKGKLVLTISEDNEAAE